jgi:hypothetical protein
MRHQNGSEEKGILPGHYLKIFAMRNKNPHEGDFEKF